MIDYTQKPFYLTPEDLAWVESTRNGLSQNEKIDQILVDMMWNLPESQLKTETAAHHFGGYRYNNQASDKIWQQNKILQSGKVPALIAANIEAGGNGGMSDGTKLGDGITIAATQNPENAYYMAYYGGKEAAAVGCNWTFAPIVDIDLNWRNCIISNRCFGSDSDMVLRMSLEYLRGAADAGLACCMKHFPGDGCDERDQHLATTVNNLSCADWDAQFGKVYQGMIDAGIPSVMIGHIMQPAYSRALRPDITDAEIMPATLAPELLQGLLREQLGFNGLIISDATHMLGLTSKKPRREFMPDMLMAGCDMILFYRDREEDLGYLRDALANGRLTQARLDEAVTTVLAFKAMLGLHKKQATGTLMPDVAGLDVVGCKEHKEKASEIIDQSVTLVKNSRDQLPLPPSTHKRVMIYPTTSGGIMEKLKRKKGVGEKLAEALRDAGYEPTIYKLKPWRYLTRRGVNGKKALSDVNITDYISKYDMAIVIADVTSFSVTNGRSLKWTIPMGPEIPWYASEVPTIGISVAHPFHLIDLPMVPIYINTYNDSQEALRQTVQKIKGESAFKGVSPVDAFCGLWDTHL